MIMININYFTFDSHSHRVQSKKLTDLQSQFKNDNEFLSYLEEHYEIKTNMPVGNILENFNRAEVLLIGERHNSVNNRRTQGEAITEFVARTHKPVALLNEDGSKVGEGQLEYVRVGDKDLVIKQWDTISSGLSQTLTINASTLDLANMLAVFSSHSFNNKSDLVLLYRELFKSFEKRFLQMPFKHHLYEVLENKHAEIQQFVKNENVARCKSFIVIKLIDLWTEMSLENKQQIKKALMQEVFERENNLKEKVIQAVEKNNLAIVTAGNDHIRPSAIEGELAKSVEDFYLDLERAHIQYIALIPKLPAPKQLAINFKEHVGDFDFSCLDTGKKLEFQEVSEAAKVTKTQINKKGLHLEIKKVVEMFEKFQRQKSYSSSQVEEQLSNFSHVFLKLFEFETNNLEDPEYGISSIDKVFNFLKKL